MFMVLGSELQKKLAMFMVLRYEWQKKLAGFVVLGSEWWTKLAGFRVRMAKETCWVYGPRVQVVEKTCWVRVAEKNLLDLWSSGLSGGKNVLGSHLQGCCWLVTEGNSVFFFGQSAPSECHTEQHRVLQFPR